MTARTYPITFTRAPSPQQEDIFAELLDGERSIVIQATAGAGKTTTLILTMKLLIAQGVAAQDILPIAFNNAIVNELKEKVPAGVTPKTLHSFGYGMLRDHLPSVGKPQGDKYSKLLTEWLGDNGVRSRVHPQYREVSDAARDLLNAARLGGEEAEAPYSTLEHLLETTQDEYPIGLTDKIVGAVQYALRAGEQQARNGLIDFTDMLWLPYIWDLAPRKRFMVVLVDESQDLNHLQRWLVKRAKKPSGRMVIVGDKNQAIYGFAGATPESMNILRDEVDALEYPLSVTYRCPARHVELAQQVVGALDIQAAPGAAAGRTGVLSKMEFERQVQEGDVILARTNRPLIEQCFKFIKAGRRARIRGKEIGEGLIRTIQAVAKPLPAFTLAAFQEARAAYQVAREGEILSRTDLSEEAQQRKVEELRDRMEVIALIAEQTEARSLADLEWRVRELFDDGQGAFILLSTIHKSKGLEFDNVYLLEGDKLPAPWATSPGDVQGERCVLFVALTRARQGLFFVEQAPRMVAGVLSRQMDEQRVLN